MRVWQPLGRKRLTEIIHDTEEDCPCYDFTPDEIYRLARELERFRAAEAKAKKETKREQETKHRRPSDRARHR